MTNYLSPFLFNFNEIIELDTEIMELFQKSSEISVPQLQDREILGSIDEDLLFHALKKKQLRKEIRRYEENKRLNKYTKCFWFSCIGQLDRNKTG